MTRAFLEQGVEIVLAHEPRKSLAKVYRTNFPEICLLEGPIEKLPLPADYDLLLAQIQIRSLTAAERRYGLEAENIQIDEILSVVHETKPRAFCFAVLHGNLDRNGWSGRFLRSLCEEGYTVMFKELSAADFGGVPFAGKSVYVIGFRREPGGEAFCFPAPVRARALGAWYLETETEREELFRRIPETVEKFILKEKAKTGAIYRRQWQTAKNRAEDGENCQVVQCERCPRLVRRSWYDTYVQTGQGIRRMTWKEYLTLQGDEKTIFPAEMSASAIWECMAAHGIFSVERRIAESLVKVLREKTGAEEGIYVDVRNEIPEYIASQFIRKIPDFTHIWADKQLGLLRMPTGTGSVSCTGRVAQEMLKRTYGKWKIVLLCPAMNLEYQLLEELGQDGRTVHVQSVKDLKRYMTEGGGGIFVVSCVKWEAYTKQLSAGNHNGMCLICYEAERCLASLGHTPKYLPQAYYIGISSRLGKPSRGMSEWFGEVKYEYRWSEAMRDRLTVPLYGEVLHQEQSDGIFADAQVRQTFAQEVFKDQVLSERAEKVLVVLDKRADVTEFCGDLSRLKSVCTERSDAAAEALDMQPKVLQERLMESDYFFLTAAGGSAYGEETIQKFRNRKRGVLVVAHMWQGLDIPELSAAYVRGQKNDYELFGIVERIVRPYEGKDRARIVFCGYSQMELLKDAVSPVMPEMERLIQALWDGDYSEGARSLMRLKEKTGVMGRRAEKELSFLEPPKDGRKPRWEEECRKLCAIWCMTAEYANGLGAKLLDRACVVSPAVEEAPEISEEQKEAETQSTPAGEFPSSYEQGAFLEEAVMALLRQLFLLDEGCTGELERQVKLVLDTLRRQRSGNQGGYDIRVVYLDSAGKKRVCLFECKNKRITEITVADIAGKLEQVKTFEKEVEHWILVAPGAKLANDVAPYLERMERYPGSQLPVRNVQVWTEENGVKELFGLVPDLYHAVYGQDPEDEDAPERWLMPQRWQILERWKQKLLPVALLPMPFMDYPERTERLLFDVCNDSRLRLQYENLYERYIKLRYFDDEGRYIDRYIEDDLEKWLFQKGHRIKILLGEFGDGKTFFTYSFGRRLLEKFRENPQENYLPVCFSLKRTREVRTPLEFINERLEELGATRADFLELKRKFHVLVCLDGLDEMSVELDRLSLLNNAKWLIKCCDELKDVKILITSRKQCFLSYEIRDVLRDGLRGFNVWQLAHVTEEEVKRLLRPILQKEDDEYGPMMPEQHKWMALAAKPLFFEMLQDLLEEGVSAGESENAVYDAYIRKCLQRKFDENFERSDIWVKRDETIERIYGTLEELAVKMQKKGQERLRIDELSAFLDDPVTEILWKENTADERTREDAQNRFSMRLLFKSEGAGEIAFAHRSIREYFVGKYLLELLKTSPAEFLRFLELYSCNFEIWGFLAEGIREEAAEMLVGRLISFLPECRVKKSAAAARILQICFLVNKKIPEGEWAGQRLDDVYIPGADFSGQNLSHSRMRNANLNNVRLDDADCSYCDFTGSRLEETKNVEALRQCGQQIRVIYADGLVRDWELARAESQVYWEGKNRLEKACLLEKGWLARKERGQRALFWEKEKPIAALCYWDGEQAELLDMAGSNILVTARLGDAEYLTAAMDCARNEVWAYSRTERKAVGRLCEGKSAVISDGEKIRIFDEEEQENDFYMQTDGLKELAAEREAQNYHLAVLGEGKLLLINYGIGEKNIRRKEYLLHAEGINHAALVYGDRIALGSYGGTVFLVSVNWESLELKWDCRQELQLGIYCRNVKTEGIVPEEMKRRLDMHCREEKNKHIPGAENGNL